jgi:predicted aminopeptidase
MFGIRIQSRKARRWLIVGVLAMVLLAVSGCKTISFYRQAVAGEYQILSSQKAIDKLIGDPNTPARLKARLELVQQLRGFADTELKLPVDGHYRKYADLHRPFVVWNVEAAREFSLEPKSWWYPLVGSLEYRGYFSEPAAQKYGRAVRKSGYDVFVGGVEAYSTLGWFKDPLLNTFIHHRDADLAEILFHELAHQRVFARGDEDFNEAFAQTVGEEGAVRWLKKQGEQEALDRYVSELKRNNQFVHLIMKTRIALAALYEDQRDENGKFKSTHVERRIDVAELRQKKRAIYDRLQRDYAALKQDWGGATDYDDWFAKDANNAKLNSVAAYYDLLPAFQRVLELNGGDLGKFYVEVERLSKISRKDRREWLKTLASTNVSGASENH